MLYIIYQKYDVTNKIIKSLESNNSNVQSIEIPIIKHSILSKICFILCSFIKNNHFIVSKEIKEKITKIKPNDKILFWDYYNYTDISYIINKTNIPIEGFFLWIWNTITPDYLSVLNPIKKLGINLYTFDLEDSIKYKIPLLNQVHYKEEIKTTNIIYDFFFIGMDKGRSCILNQLALFLDSKGYTYKFIIVKTHETNYTSDKIDYINSPIPYHEILKYISESQIIVDITQCNQAGITLRALESLFYNKKLLTNNTYIKQLDIYNSNNILIMDNENIYKKKIERFYNERYTPYKQDILKKYQIEEWIKTFL